MIFASKADEGREPTFDKFELKAASPPGADAEDMVERLKLSGVIDPDALWDYQQKLPPRVRFLRQRASLISVDQTRRVGSGLFSLWTLSRRPQTLAVTKPGV